MCIGPSRPDRDRNDQVQYADRVDPETVLKVFHDRDDTARPVTAGDVVEELGIARRTAHNKLNALVERGVLETRKVGARGRVWWTPQHDTAGATASDDATVDESPTTGKTTSTGHDKPTTAAQSRENARGVLEALNRSGSGRDYERRVEAVLTMYDHLKANPGDRVQRADLKALLDGVDVGYAGGFASLWSNWVKGHDDRENAPAALPGVELRENSYVYTEP